MSFEVQNNNTDITCKSKNVIYLLICKNFNIQYVGETGQSFNIRNNSHRSSTVNMQKHTGCPIIHEHFTIGQCKGQEYWCHIIEKISDTGTEKQQRDKRKVREGFWIRELRTVYPYGLNSRLDNVDHRRQNVHEVNFNKQDRYSNRKRGTKRGKDLQWNSEDVIKEIKLLSCNNINTLRRYCCKILPQIPRKLLKDIYRNILDSQVVPLNIKDLMNHMTLKFVFDKSPDVKKIERPILKMEFINKGIELLNLNRIMNDKEVSDSCPVSRPMIVLNYTKPVRSKILNYRQTVQESNFDSWRSDEGVCNCHRSIFKDPNHNHVITGNLNIISNFKLRKLLSKGPGYREPRNLNFDLASNTVKNAIKTFIESQSVKVGLPVESFNEWKCRIFEKIDNNIRTLKNRYRYHRRIRSTLKDENVLSELEEIKKKYVITVVDKASKNYAFICKWYYMKVIYKELGKLEEEGVDTYIPVEETEYNMIDIHSDYMKRINITIQEDHKSLPFIYWIPKFHKSPVKARFIIASSRSTTKKLANNISICLKHLILVRKSYCKKIQDLTGIKRWWIIDNNVDVISQIREINESSGAKNINTYDFSTLYTNIPHEKLKVALKNMINKTFAATDKKFITVYNQVAYFTSNKSQNKVSFSRIQFIEVVEFLIDNSYFKCGNLVMKQNIGIPMGTDPGPDFANLFLHFYEFNFLERNSKTQYMTCKKLNYSFRFIDDIASLNGEGTFEDVFVSIYPEELILTKENQSNLRASFLDLDIEIINKKFDIGLYDKRKDYNFNIVNFPFLDGNVPLRQSYGVFTSQVIRYLRICTNFQNFIQEIRTLIQKLSRQGFRLAHLEISFMKLTQRIKDKYRVNNNDIHELRHFHR